MVVDFGHIVNLRMAVMTRRDTIGRTRGKNLIGLGLPVSPPLFLETGLQVAAAAAATKIVGHIGCHIDKIFFTDNRLDHITEIFGNRITQRFSDQLAGILYGEFDLSLFIPVG